MMHPLLLLSLFCALSAAHAATLRQYDRDWLMTSEDSGSSAPRRITAKSVFVAPSNVRCSPGWRANADGRCERVVTVRQEAQIQFLSQKLSALFGSFPVAVRIEETTTTSTQTPETTLKPLDLATSIAEEENVAAEVVDYVFSGDGPMELDFEFMTRPDTTTTEPSSPDGTVTPSGTTEKVYLVAESENTSEVPTTTESYEESELSTEKVELVVVDSSPSKLIKDNSHAVDSVQVVEAELDATTEAMETTSLATTPATTDRPDEGDETTTDVEVVESAQRFVVNDEPEKSVVNNQNTLSVGTFPENVQIVYAQTQNTNADTVKPLVDPIKPSEEDLTGLHLQNHNLTPSKVDPLLSANTPPSINKFPDYPFGLDEIHRPESPPPHRPLADDFHHREGFVRFPSDERVNVVKFPYDRPFPEDKYSNWRGGWRVDTRRGRPPPPPMGFWNKMPLFRNPEQGGRRNQYDRRRPPPVF